MLLFVGIRRHFEVLVVLCNYSYILTTFLICDFKKF